jgi:hypothetical protein
MGSLNGNGPPTYDVFRGIPAPLDDRSVLLEQPVDGARMLEERGVTIQEILAELALQVQLQRQMAPHPEEPAAFPQLLPGCEEVLQHIAHDDGVEVARREAGWPLDVPQVGFNSQPGPRAPRWPG